MIKHGFLSNAERSELLRIARNGLEEHRVSRRANAILLLNDGMSFKQVAAALYIDDSTIRAWRKAYEDGGIDALDTFDLKGGFSPLSTAQMDTLRAWANETLPESTAAVGHFILERFDLDYTRSGLIKLMHRIGFDWKKPETVPGKIDVETQQRFIEKHEDLRNSIGADEAIVYVDAVHPTHQSNPGGRWLPRGDRCAVATASGRERLNLHGAIDLETGMTRIIEVMTVDAQSTINLFEALERAYPNMRRIHVYLDNASYHHARLVKQWLEMPGRKIVLYFVPAYCPHLNPIERLWFVMHKHVTHRYCFAKFRDYAKAMLTFLRETVPQKFAQFASTITDNFRVIDPTIFRIVA
jgi:transposase